MGGKSSQSSSTVTIPPEVLARYNAVNQRADQVTNQPYQNYTGEFVAPVNAQQQQGISGINAAANQAQPYYGAATGQLLQSQNAAQGYNRAATRDVYGAQNVGNVYANQATQSLQGAGQAAAGLQGQAAQAYGSAYGNAQPYNNVATSQYLGAQGAAQPLQNQAAQNISNAQAVGGDITQNAYGTLQGAGQAAAGLQGQAAQGYSQAYAGAQPYNANATSMYGAALQSAAPLNQQSAQNVANAQAAGANYINQATGSLQGAGRAAAPLQNQAAQAYNQAVGVGQAGGLAAGGLYNQALAQSQGYNQAAAQGISGAQAAANPLNQIATGLAGAATQAVNASPLDTAAINQYMSPYLQNVVGSQAQLLNQSNQQAMAGQLGNAVRSGAFGGDRASIAAANLNQQQQLANASIFSNLLNQGYNTALQTAQQQQGVNLGAGQANRAALMAGSQQLGALGQQQFGQGMTAAQQQAALGQQVYGQNAGIGQNVAALSQQLYGQGLGAGQAQAALGQQQYAQGANTAAQQAALGQQQFGQGLSAAQQQAALGQQQYGQLTGAGQNIAAIGQQQFGQGTTTAQNQAALAQQQYAQGANTAAQQAAIGQQLYGQGMGAAQQQAALGQQQFGQANVTGQNVAALGQQQFGQGLAAGQAQQSLGQQQYAQGANTAAQQAALGQQQFGQGLNAAQQQAAIGQQLYGQGANTSNALAALGLGAQNAALQGAQAQIGAGTLQQQTQQAQNQALYNQFLQAQSLPYQQLAQQAAIAEGTGALSGSTTFGLAPGGFFSDERLKEDIEPVGKTFDGQTVYKYRYKGDSKDKTQIGLIAQDVEHKHPSAVGLAGGYKTVDYDKATHAAADRGHFYAGGLVPESMGGHVDASHLGEGYAYGGVPDGSTPVAPGLTSADMAALLQAQGAMYAPGHGGLYGAAPGGAPYGGTQLVPAQTNATPRMMQPGELPKTKSPMEHVKEVADAAKSIQGMADSKAGKWAVDKAKKLWNKSTAPESSASTNWQVNDSEGEAHGGAIGHYAEGGLASADEDLTKKTSLDVPIPSASNKLQAPELPSQGKSGLSDLADVAKVAAMFMSHGGLAGRHGYALDGSVEGRFYDDPNDPEVIRQRAAEVRARTPGQVYGTQTATPAAAQSGVAGAEAEAAATRAAAAARTGTGGASGLINRGLSAAADAIPEWMGTAGRIGGRLLGPASLALTPTDTATQTQEDIAMGRNIDPVTGKLMGLRPNPVVAPPSATSHKPMQDVRRAAQKPPVAAPAPVSPAPSALTAQDQNNIMNLPTAPAAPVVPAGGLAPPVQGALTPGSEGNVSMQRYLDRMSPAAVPQAAPAAAGKPSIIDKIKSGLLQNEKGEYDSSKIIPLLTGIAAMGTAPTRSLGTALAAGVGAGAQAYLPTKQRQAQIAQTEAETATGLNAAATQGEFVTLANGQRMLKGQYRALAAQGKAPALMGQSNVAGISGAPVGATANGTPQENLAQMAAKPTNRYVGDVGNASIERDYNKLVQMEPEQWGDDRDTSHRTELGIVQNATSAHQQGATLAQLAPTLMKMEENGILAPGPLNELRSSLVARFNDIIRSVGASVGVNPQNYVIGDVRSDDPMALKAAADKLGAAMQFARANGADQNSLGALEAAAKAIPTTSLSKPQAMQVLASLYVDKQHALDQEQYLREYKDNLAALHPGMGNMYLAQNAINSFRQDPNHSEISYGKAKQALLDVLKRSADIYSGKIDKRFIDRYGEENYGIKGLSRFLENY